jgi:hypothetical protein
MDSKLSLDFTSATRGRKCDQTLRAQQRELMESVRFDGSVWTTRDAWKTPLHRGRASQKGAKCMRKSEMSGEEFHAKTRSLVVYSASRQRLLSDLPL